MGVVIGDLALTLATVASASVVSFASTWAFARRRIRTAEERAESLARGLSTQREAAERRVREVKVELARLESTSLARQRVMPEQLYVGRLAPRDADALASALGGLAFVDAALVADGAGHALSRGTGDASGPRSSPALALSSLAAAAGVLARDLAAAGLVALEVHVETADARHLTARALRGRGEGNWVLAATTSLPVSPLAVDAVAQLAAGRDGRDASDAELGAAGRSAARGASDVRAVRESPLGAVLAELEKEHAEHRDLRAVLLGVDGTPVFSAATDGPAEHTRARALRALDTFARRSAHRLRDTYVARLDVVLEGGDVLRWAPLAARARLALVVLGDVASTAPGRIERLAGRLRRKIAESAPTLDGGAR